jgi:hypothetical protein
MDPSTALALALAALAAYVASESTFLHVSRTARRAFLAGVGGAVGWAAAGALPQLDAWWLVASAVSGMEGREKKKQHLARERRLAGGGGRDRGRRECVFEYSARL